MKSEEDVSSIRPLDDVSFNKTTNTVGVYTHTHTDTHLLITEVSVSSSRTLFSDMWLKQSYRALLWKGSFTAAALTLVTGSQGGTWQEDREGEKKNLLLTGLTDISDVGEEVVVFSFGHGFTEFCRVLEHADQDLQTVEVGVLRGDHLKYGLRRRKRVTVSVSRTQTSSSSHVHMDWFPPPVVFVLPRSFAPTNHSSSPEEKHKHNPSEYKYKGNSVYVIKAVVSGSVTWAGFYPLSRYSSFSFLLTEISLSSRWNIYQRITQPIGGSNDT